ncbi:hypothetical protein EST38_g8290 [Candolleomyces aberdarensis]|uniref:Uncharacterized protein n=1 Tax=Candolleomyces aberdarensis TaxID=2316362 RepID=A0A4Q2DGB8_9AGAR|nr:hypothetical protein EST38_g8290 [Candolleomyces aberdarensis]
MFSKLKRLLASVFPRRARARRAEQKMLVASNDSIFAAQSVLSLPTPPSLSSGSDYDADGTLYLDSGNNDISLDLYPNWDDEENSGTSAYDAYSSSFYAGSSASFLSDSKYSYSGVGFNYHHDNEGQSDLQESKTHDLRDIAIRNILYRVSIIRQLSSVLPMSALEDSLSFNVPPPLNKDIGLGHWIAPFLGSQQVLVRVEQILGAVPEIQRKVFVHPPCAGQYYVMDAYGSKYLMEFVEEDGSSYRAGSSSSEASIASIMPVSSRNDFTERQCFHPGEAIHAYIHNRRYTAMVVERLPVLLLEDSDSEFCICSGLEARVSHSESEHSSIASLACEPSFTNPYPTPPHDASSFLSLTSSDCASRFVWKKRKSPPTVWWLLTPDAEEPELEASTDSDAAVQGECGIEYALEPVSFEWDWENRSWVLPADTENEPLIIHSPQPSRIIDVDLLAGVESGLRDFV